VKYLSHIILAEEVLIDPEKTADRVACSSEQKTGPKLFRILFLL